MLRNYILIGIRNLLKHGVYSGINIVGMSMGIAFFSLLFLLVNYEMSYDEFHKAYDRTYRIVEIIDTEDIGERSASVPIGLGPTLKTLYSNYVDASVRFFNHQAYSHMVFAKDRQYNEKHLYFTEPDFFKIFNFPLIAGDQSTALEEPQTAIVTKEIAQKYFGDEDPIGKKILYENRFYLTITGVIDKTNYPSHLDFEILVSFSTLLLTDQEIMLRDRWVWNPCWTYVLLKEGVKPEELEADFEVLYQDKSKFPDYLRDYVQLYLQPIWEIHLYSDLDFEMSPNGDYMYIYIFSSIALMVLLIAAINFMNLSAVRYSTRMREVGIRKAIGADQTELIFQFLVEAIILSILSMFGAVMFMELLFPLIYPMLGDSGFILREVDTQKLIILIGGSGIFVAALSSFYPLYYLSGFKPIDGLQESKRMGRQQKGFRKWSVIVQFIIAMFLLFSTYVSKRQLDFMRESDIGFDTKDVMLIPLGEVRFQSNQIFKLKKEFLNIYEIEAVTGIDEIMGVWVQNYPISFKVKDKVYPSSFYAGVVTNPEFFDVFDVKIIAKNDLYNDGGLYNNRYIYVNEAFVDFMGYTSPEEALNTTFWSKNGYINKIAGVVKDFNYEPVHKPIEPFVIDINNVWRLKGSYAIKFLALKIKSGANWTDVERKLEILWSKVIPYRLMDVFSLNDKIEASYQKEERLARVSLIFSIIGVIIANMGLFGLSSFITVQRKKEIAIRKALGMENIQAMLLLSKEFFTLVGTACLIAWPTAYLAMRLWLENFPKIITIDLGAYIFSGGVTLVLTFLTVSYHVVKVGIKSPVEDLKSVQ
ncbi:ABC transporter permease [Flammeovirga agarivorans]|uniref:FtsX-like permease family protein n=1 Tax=Flammeovirga agarivorans TaxID=2726742 RepID=A0A7X8XU95_9BACT|nr:ABC transporter permease [Flammeovirga agarivorans]NLR90034.1 FtsX-like permease family protein [Flammeovirga agarivorans]